MDETNHPVCFILIDLVLSILLHLSIMYDQCRKDWEQAADTELLPDLHIEFLTHIFPQPGLSSIYICTS